MNICQPAVLRMDHCRFSIPNDRVGPRFQICIHRVLPGVQDQVDTACRGPPDMAGSLAESRVVTWMPDHYDRLHSTYVDAQFQC